MQLFFQDHGGDNRHVSGFGWMNDSKFFYGQYDVDDLNPKNPNGYNRLVLKKGALKEIDYVRKERGLQPSEDEVPASFAITMFHIVFMYPTNITVVSKISRQVVFNHSFEKSRPLRGVVLDTQKHQLLAFSHKEKIMIASLYGEDQDAWKYFLKEKSIKTALTYCRTAKQRAYVSAIFANQLFKQGKYDTAANYYINSGLTFETVCLKYLEANQGIRLLNYLNLVLDKLKAKSEAEAPPA